MKHFVLWSFLFLYIPVNAMDLDPTKQLDTELQKDVQHLQELWDQIKIGLQQSVEKQDLNSIFHIFNSCFKKGSLLNEHKHEACKIVRSFVQEALEEQCIIGLINSYEALKIADNMDLYNAKFRSILEDIDVGTIWLQTDKLVKPLNTEQVLADWDRIIHKYLTKAFEQNDIALIDRIVRINSRYRNPDLKSYLLALNDFMLAHIPHRAELAKEHALHNTFVENNVEEEIIELSANVTDLEQTKQTNEAEVIIESNTNQQGIFTWMKQNPIIIGAGIITVLCAGAYAYFKKSKNDKIKHKTKPV